MWPLLWGATALDSIVSVSAKQAGWAAINKEWWIKMSCQNHIYTLIQAVWIRIVFTCITILKYSNIWVTCVTKMHHLQTLVPIKKSMQGTQKCLASKPVFCYHFLGITGSVGREGWPDKVCGFCEQYARMSISK